MIVSVSQFDVYSGNCEDSQDVVSMKESMLSAAQEIVAEYLGYNPESSEHTDYVQGIGNDHLYLFAQPITEVDAVTYNGITLLSTAFDIREKYLRIKIAQKKAHVRNEQKRVRILEGLLVEVLRKRGAR